jgi:hypothetical protein
MPDLFKQGSKAFCPLTYCVPVAVITFFPDANHYTQAELDPFSE